MCIAQSEARRRRDPRHVDGGGAVGGGPVPELTTGVPPSALDRAARQQGARVVMVAQSEARCRRDPGHVDGCGAVCGGPVPELAVVVTAPALKRATRATR